MTTCSNNTLLCSSVAAKCADHRQPQMLSCIQSSLLLRLDKCMLRFLMGDTDMQVELFSEAVAGKAINAGWQSLSKDVLPEPDANKLFAMPG